MDIIINMLIGYGVTSAWTGHVSLSITSLGVALFLTRIETIINR